MAASNAEQPIRFEPEEACPPSVALVVGFQGAVLILAPMVLNVAIAIRSSGLDDTWLAWSVFRRHADLRFNNGGASPATGAIRVRARGADLPRLRCLSAMMVGTVNVAGPGTYASLMIVCSLIQIALAWWLPTLRRIITPTVSGTVTMLVAVSVLPIAFNSVQGLPGGRPRGRRPDDCRGYAAGFGSGDAARQRTLAPGGALHQHPGGMRRRCRLRGASAPIRLSMPGGLAFPRCPI